MRARRRARGLIVAVIVLAVVILLGATVFKEVQSQFYRAAYPMKYSEAVEKACRDNDLPPSLVYAIIRTESSFRPEVESSIGARGLMQITEETYDWTVYRMGEEGGQYDSLFDADTNIKYGGALLRLLFDEFGSVENVLCAYHAGWGNAQSWRANPEHAPGGDLIENIPFGDTSRYVVKVLETRKKYQELYQLR